MSENIIIDMDLWLASIAAGACMAFAYDILRLFRRLVRHGRLAVDLEDMLYWAACFFASFTLLYYGNNGVIRFVAVFGAALGMLAYIVSAGRVFVKFSHFLINKTIIRFLRLIGGFARRLHRITHYVNRRNREFLENVGIINKIRKIQKFLLTNCIFHNTIKKNRDFFISKKGERGSTHEKSAKVQAGKK